VPTAVHRNKTDGECTNHRLKASNTEGVEVEYTLFIAV